MKIKGYRRPDGSFGIRNHLLIIPTSVCAYEVGRRIADQIEGAVAIPNQHGCCQIGSDLALTQKTVAGFGLNPNVGAVLIIGLGCDGIQARALAATIAASGKPVETVVIQDVGGTVQAIARGCELAAPLARMLSAEDRVEGDLSEIVLALECGGSDPTSGLASNPCIGHLADHIVRMGGSAILSETTEVIGAEHLIAARFTDPAQQARFLAMVKHVENRAIAMGEDLRSGQPTPGNKVGGLSTIEEKSLGCMYKAGTVPFTGALSYAERLPRERPGMYFMDTPGQDIESVTGMVAGGAQVVVFSTGRGTPTGCPIAPVIKLTGNPQTYERMAGNLDLNAGRIISEGATLCSIGSELVDLLVETCNGRRTKAESLGHREFGIYKLAGTF